MRRFAPLLLFLFVAAFQAPVTSAVLSHPAGASCCRRAGSAVCCRFDGSCVMTSCRGPDREARTTGLEPFTVSSSFALSLPTAVRWFRAAPAERPEPGSPMIFDPPPRA